MMTHSRIHTCSHTETQSRGGRGAREEEGQRETRGMRQSQTWAHLEKSRRKEREAKGQTKGRVWREQRDSRVVSRPSPSHLHMAPTKIQGQIGLGLYILGPPLAWLPLQHLIQLGAKHSVGAW